MDLGPVLPNGISAHYIEPGVLPPFNLNRITLEYKISDRTVILKDQKQIDIVRYKISEDIKHCSYDGVFFYSIFCIHEDKINREYIIELGCYCEQEVIKL